MAAYKPPRWHSSRAATKQILLIHLAQLLLPESVFVHNIFRVDHSRYATSQIFNPFTCRTAFDRAVIAVGFRVCFLNQRQPSLVRFAVREVQGFAAALESVFELVRIVVQACAFLLVAIPVSHDAQIVVVADSHVQLVVDDLVYPFAI